MRVFTTLPQENLREVAAAARAIEADGYDGVVSMENKHDPFLALAIAGAVTERIELHTGVAIAFARIANGGSPGRLGSCRCDWRPICRRAWLAGARPQRAPVFGAMDTAGPAHARICPGIARDLACWKTGERPSYEGEHYRFTLMTPNFTPEPIDAPPPAVMIAAVGPAMLRLPARNATASSCTAFAPAVISRKG